MTPRFGWVLQLWLSVQVALEGIATPLDRAYEVDPTGICADLCEAGLSGDPCGDVCVGRRQFPSQSNLVVGRRSNVGPRRGVCPTLCSYGLGEPLCDCDLETIPVTVDWTRVCDAFQRSGYELYGCSVSRIDRENAIDEVPEKREHSSRVRIIRSGPRFPALDDEEHDTKTLSETSHTFEKLARTIVHELRHPGGKDDAIPLLMINLSLMILNDTLGSLAANRKYHDCGNMEHGPVDTSSAFVVVRANTSREAMVRNLVDMSVTLNESLTLVDERGRKGHPDLSVTRGYLAGIAASLKILTVSHCQEVGDIAVDPKNIVVDTADNNGTSWNGNDTAGVIERDSDVDTDAGVEAGVNWEQWCMTQCGNGAGGAACNCDILP